LTIVLFAFGAVQYARHPEGILEFQKRRGTARFERFFPNPQPPDDLTPPPALSSSSTLETEPAPRGVNV
jgi:hypothetical protein